MIRLPTDTSSGHQTVRIAPGCSHYVNQPSSCDCLTRAVIRPGKWVYWTQCTQNQDGELVRGIVCFSGLTLSSFICKDQVCVDFLFLLLHFQAEHHLGLSADRHGGSVLLSWQMAANIPTQNDLTAAKCIWCKKRTMIIIHWKPRKRLTWFSKRTPWERRICKSQLNSFCRKLHWWLT